MICPLSFSIIIPLYNRASSIDRVIADLRGRFTGAFEVIIVDDGSHDDSADAARRALAKTGEHGRVIEQENAGPGAARNTGAQAARGHWLIFHDSDDSWYPWTLDIITSTLIKTPTLAVMFFQEIIAPGGARPVATESRAVIETYPGTFEALDAKTGMAIGSCNMVMRRDVFETLGGFDTQQRYAEDNDLIYRAAASGACALISAPVMMALSRGLGDHLTNDSQAAIHGFSQILSQARNGAYPNAPFDKKAQARELALIATKLVRRHYELGQLRQAYLVWISNLGVWVKAGAWHSLLRAPLAPILALCGAKNYQYVRFRKQL